MNEIKPERNINVPNPYWGEKVDLKMCVKCWVR